MPSPPLHLREERKLQLCESMIDIAAALFNVSGRELRNLKRSSTAITRVRQVAMYVAHVSLGLTMGDVGKGFGRDRTTVSYACHMVEDLRDDPEFDRIVATIERIALAALRCAGDA
ncbi:MAG: helix-turn-helix domain-containing protein [Rhizobiaceae bacterium]